MGYSDVKKTFDLLMGTHPENWIVFDGLDKDIRTIVK